MTSGAGGLSPESESFIKEVIETFQNVGSKAMLHVLLTDHEAWERFVVEATLSREEADALRGRLNELQEAKDLEAKEQQARERFLHKFPELKLKIEERIRKLHELADEVDRVHRDATIYSVASDSAAVTSGVLSILGLVLAPYAAVACLVVSAISAGLGVASGVTGIYASSMEMSSECSSINEANRLILSDTDEDEVFQKFLDDYIDSIFSQIDSLYENLKDLAANVRAIRAARVNPQLAVQAQRFSRGLPVSGRTARQVQNTFRDTALTMTRGARIRRGLFSVLSLGLDVYDLVKDSMHLQEGAKAESAEDMRRRARDLESKLEKLSEFYERLREGPPP
ncbi:apolipoprotein L3-like [Mustela lutreola]|uniref:apolipoprotein L3-like n=1 Tax=Mustela lutreola TaxID=9666 RepID=UPI0027973D21|nr:apolipoprotein L3-like [Mustela lutreola]